MKAGGAAAGQALARPTIADYDRLASRWVAEVVLPRCQRTTGRVVLEAWEAKQPLLTAIPERLVADVEGEVVEATVIDLSRLEAEGAVVEHGRSRPTNGSPVKPSPAKTSAYQRLCTHLVYLGLSTAEERNPERSSISHYWAARGAESFYGS